MESRSGKLVGGGVPELRGDHVAQGVGGEVAEGAAVPVDVLHDALGVARHVEPEVLLVAGVPGVGQILEREGLLEERHLELEADGDVEVVGDLVGLDADQRALDGVRRAVEVLGVDGAERLGEVLGKEGLKPANERPAAADPVLPQAALGLVEAQRRRLADRVARGR